MRFSTVLKTASFSDNKSDRMRALRKLVNERNLAALIRVLNDGRYNDVAKKAEEALSGYCFK